ncbi:hypothetical protein [Nocardioides sp. R-C-SC26]|uniref:hypothetical protein n=1 Tax=Nocardioides sp. R-C-SC26 TaxID=2870414 RepID=UPI001E4A7F9E|nr:hypothetical protein [Nocardioides sp. R-C-SC26]
MTSASSSRTAVTGIAAGVLLLGGLGGFAIGLPEWIDDGGSTTSAAIPTELPDVLPGGLVASDSGKLPAEMATEEDIARIAEVRESAAEGLSGLFEGDAIIRSYASVDRAKAGFVMVVAVEPGLFVPQGPPVDPAISGMARDAFELIRIDDAICDLNWGQPVPAGQPIDEAAEPAAVRCQLGANGATYEANFIGVPAETVVEILHTIAGESQDQ